VSADFPGDVRWVLFNSTLAGDSNPSDFVADSQLYAAVRLDITKPTPAHSYAVQVEGLAQAPAFEGIPRRQPPPHPSLISGVRWQSWAVSPNVAEGRLVPLVLWGLHGRLSPTTGQPFAGETYFLTFTRTQIDRARFHLDLYRLPRLADADPEHLAGFYEILDSVPFHFDQRILSAVELGTGRACTDLSRTE
jgi:hypothetical protein